MKKWYLNNFKFYLWHILLDDCYWNTTSVRSTKRFDFYNLHFWTGQSRTRIKLENIRCLFQYGSNRSNISDLTFIILLFPDFSFSSDSVPFTISASAFIIARKLHKTKSFNNKNDIVCLRRRSIVWLFHLPVRSISSDWKLLPLLKKKKHYL